MFYILDCLSLQVVTEGIDQTDPVAVSMYWAVLANSCNLYWKLLAAFSTITKKVISLLIFPLVICNSIFLIIQNIKRISIIDFSKKIFSPKIFVWLLPLHIGQAWYQACKVQRLEPFVFISSIHAFNSLLDQSSQFSTVMPIPIKYAICNPKQQL